MKRFTLAWLAAAVLTAWPAGAQDKEEKKLPEFSLKTAQGESFAGKYEGAELAIGRKVKATLLHFFQPDCNACVVEMKALDFLSKELAPKGAVIASVAHRGDQVAVKAVAERHKLSYPLVLGQGSDLVKTFSRGDATVIADGKGVVRFSQVGFKEGDERIFRETLEKLLADKAVTAETNERRRLQVGETMPAVQLPSLMSGKPISMTVEGGKLTYRDESGKEVHPKAAVGFFSRY